MAKYFCLVLMIMLAAGCQRASNTAEISVEEVWSRPVMVAASEAMADSAMTKTPHTGSNGVVYLMVKNRGGAADRLLRAHNNVCETTELHETIMDGDRMKMQPAENGFEVPAHGQVKLEPAGRHIMLMGLKHSLAVGDSIELHLDFEKSGTKTVFSVVRQP